MCFLAVRTSRQHSASQPASINPRSRSRPLSRSFTSPSLQKGLRGIRCAGNIRFGVWPSRPSRCSTDDRSHAENTPLPVVSDGAAQRVGMKLKFVPVPAKRTAETGDGYLYVGDEVLKCRDLNGYATFVWFCWRGAFENPAGMRTLRALFLQPPHSWSQVGKLPWRKMLRYFWQSWEESGSSYGRGTVWRFHAVGLSLQKPQIQEPPGAQTLPRVQAQFDLRLIEPLPCLGCVVHGEPVPEAAAFSWPRQSISDLGAVRIEVVHDQVDRTNPPVMNG